MSFTNKTQLIDHINKVITSNNKSSTNNNVKKLKKMSETEYSFLDQTGGAIMKETLDILRKNYEKNYDIKPNTLSNNHIEEIINQVAGAASATAQPSSTSSLGATATTPLSDPSRAEGEHTRRIDELTGQLSEMGSGSGLLDKAVEKHAAIKRNNYLKKLKDTVTAKQEKYDKLRRRSEIKNALENPKISIPKLEGFNLESSGVVTYEYLNLVTNKNDIEGLRALYEEAFGALSDINIDISDRDKSIKIFKLIGKLQKYVTAIENLTRKIKLPQSESTDTALVELNNKIKNALRPIALTFENVDSGLLTKSSGEAATAQGAVNTHEADHPDDTEHGVGAPEETHALRKIQKIKKIETKLENLKRKRETLEKRRLNEQRANEQARVQGIIDNINTQTQHARSNSDVVTDDVVTDAGGLGYIAGLEAYKTELKNYKRDLDTDGVVVGPYSDKLQASAADYEQLSAKYNKAQADADAAAQAKADAAAQADADAAARAARHDPADSAHGATKTGAEVDVDRHLALTEHDVSDAAARS